MTIQRIGVIGAGIMGRGIAQVAATGGYETLLHDVDPMQLEQSVAKIHSSLQRALERGKVDQTVLETVRANLKTTTSLDDVGGKADLIIEAVPERIHLKIEILGELDRICPTHTILATNTSSRA